MYVNVILGFIAGVLTLFTIVGNLLVIIAFKINKKLRILSNYCLVSLAVSDLTVGVFLMPVYTVYLLIGYWPLGRVTCNIWLSMDYTLCTASLANLLIIAVDRHLSVTRPLRYRAKRTSKKMGIAIASAWAISFLIWPPWIFAWPYIEGESSVPSNECYVQFLKTNAIITTVNSLLTFYIPVTVTIILYVVLCIRTKQRRRRMKAIASNCISVNKSLQNKHNTVFINRSFLRYLCCRDVSYSERYDLENGFGERNLQVMGTNYNIEVEEENLSSACSCDRNDNTDKNEFDDETEDKFTNINEHCVTVHRGSTEHHENCDDQQCAREGFSSSKQRIHMISCSVRGAPCQGPDSSSLSIQQRGKKAKACHTEPERHHDRRIVKILSATLLAMIISNGPYFTVALVGAYWNGCVNSVLHGIGMY